MAKPLRIHNAQQVACGSVLHGAAEADDLRSRQREDPAAESRSSLEQHFEPTFATRLALREKQIQQNYRPIIGIHKWFARRPGTVFRSLLLAEFNGSEPLETSYWREHKMTGVIADPFMGAAPRFTRLTALDSASWVRTRTRWRSGSSDKLWDASTFRRSPQQQRGISARPF